MAWRKITRDYSSLFQELSMAQVSSNKRKQAPEVKVHMRTRKEKIPRYATVVPPLFAEYETSDETTQKGVRLRLKFRARYTKMLLLPSHYGLELSEGTQKLYIRCGAADDNTLNEYLESASDWAVQALEAAREDVMAFFKDKVSGTPALVVEGGASNFGTITEKTFFPGQYTKYFRKDFEQKCKEASVGSLMGKGNSTWCISLEMGTMDITANEKENSLLLTPYCNVQDITWLNRGQDTHVEDKKKEEYQAEYMNRLDGFITAQMQKAETDETKDAKNYSSEDSEHPENVLPPNPPKLIKAKAKPARGRGRGRGRQSTRRMLDVSAVEE